MSLFGKKSTLAPLLQAAKDGKAQDVRAQVQQGADVNQVDADKGLTALMFAAEYGKVEAAKVLLEAKANVNLATKKGTTALMYAALAGNMELTQALLNAGADHKVKDVNGQTAFVLAREKAKAQGMYADEQLCKVRDFLATLPA
ncbi:MAG: ankyrin repeat domain-containing protein [Chloroflexi bacterium]|nr:ankyrin repeat domain-containing protein [Chloroflexota bacterium]